MPRFPAPCFLPRRRLAQHFVNNIWACCSTFPFYRVTVRGREGERQGRQGEGGGGGAVRVGCMEWVRGGQACRWGLWSEEQLGTQVL